MGKQSPHILQSLPLPTPPPWLRLILELPGTSTYERASHWPRCPDWLLPEMMNWTEGKKPRTAKRLFWEQLSALQIHTGTEQDLVAAPALNP